MTPKQAAKCLVHFSRKHADLKLSSFVIAQVPGTVPRSKPVRGVLESLIKSKRYVVPLAPLALIHPVVGGGMAYAWLEGCTSSKRVVAAGGRSPLKPEMVVNDLR